MYRIETSIDHNEEFETLSNLKIFFSHSLRTSETSYLNEAFSFYSAIRQRSYYSQVNKEDRYAPTIFLETGDKTLNF